MEFGFAENVTELCIISLINIKGTMYNARNYYFLQNYYKIFHLEVFAEPNTIHYAFSNPVQRENYLAFLHDFCGDRKIAIEYKEYDEEVLYNE